MAACWAYDYKIKANLPNRYAFSQDEGHSYSRAFDSPLRGETCTPVALPDNHILCVYRRMDKPGLWSHLAKIDGQTWQPLTESQLWGRAVEAHKTDSDSMLAQMSTLRFGYPSVIRLENGEIAVVFWCVEDCVSNIRWFRLAIEI